MNHKEQQVIQDILRGDKEAFRYLIEKYDKKIYGYIYRIVGDKYLAEDVTQETFIKVYRNLRYFHQDKEFLPWAYTIAHNTAVNFLNRHKKRKLFSLKENLDSIQDTRFTPYYNPEYGYQMKELNRSIYEKINSLPEKYRVLIILKYVEGLSYKAIGERLNLPEKKIESRLYQGRQKLIKMFGKCGEYQQSKGVSLVELQSYTKVNL